MKTIITGAAQGLGLALTRATLARGDDLVAVDVDASALAQLPTDGCEHLALDLTAAEAAEQIAARGPIDLIIHSAGISGTGPFEAIPAHHHARILALNFEAPVALTCHLLAAGAMSAIGAHVFIGSLSTFTGYPGAVSYAASKDGLASFAGSLKKALPKGQSAFIVYPGPMATDHAARYAPDNSEKVVAARQSTEEAAALILEALDRGKHTIIPGPKAKALAVAGRIAPGHVGRMLKRGLYDKLTTPKT